MGQYLLVVRYLIFLANTLLCPGGGLISLGKSRAGQTFLYLFLLALALFVMMRLIHLPQMTFGLLVAIGALHCLSIVASFRSLYAIKASNRFAALKLGALVTAGFFVGLFSTFNFKSFLLGFEIYAVRGLSMQTTLQSGDWVVGDTWVSVESLRKRDVVMVTDPESPRVLVKRIIALSGESVLFTSSEVTVFPTRSPQITTPPVNQALKNMLPGELFVVGDNLARSRDSRHFGIINFDSIQAKALWAFRFSNGSFTFWEID